MNACGGAVFPVVVNMAAGVRDESARMVRKLESAGEQQTRRTRCRRRPVVSRDAETFRKVAGVLIDVFPPLAERAGPSAEVCFAFLAISTKPRRGCCCRWPTLRKTLKRRIRLAAHLRLAKLRRSMHQLHGSFHRAHISSCRSRLLRPLQTHVGCVVMSPSSQSLAREAPQD